MKVGTFENISKAVLKWFTSMHGFTHGLHIPINDPIILEKTQKFACDFHCKDFQESNDWLRGWKEK